jgi:tetratricopeptide (TPR) repeat protein/serine/threonine protein kinase
MNQSALETLQGELERLYDLEEMMRLSADLLGFAPAAVGGTGSKGAFARSLVGYCVNEDALAALVDAILLSSERADVGLRQTLRNVSNGELSPGTRVGTMKVVKKLADGGLSVVYLAEAESGAQTVLRVIRHEYSKDRAAVHRFTTASRAMQSLRTPGLAPIVGVGQLADLRPWVAEELVHGQALSERIKDSGPLHINDARSVFEGVLQGLIALHKRGLVHGDVKVENVFVVSHGGEPSTSAELSGVLVEAGTERLLSRSASKFDATAVFPLIGTAKAMAPEQARGHEPDVRSDIYGMGTLIYETLTGRPPFIGESAIDVIAQHVSAMPEAPSVYARRGWVSEALDELVLRALAKEPSERFPDVAALSDALEHVSSRPSKRRPLDEVAFTQARSVLLKDPAHEAAADAVENQARDSGAWDRAATVFTEAGRAARGAETRLTLLFRAARIYESDLKDPLRAESVYQQILELEPSNAIALRGVESARRASGDYHGLLEILLDRAERETSQETRSALLHEVAMLYEEKLLDGNNAVVAWVQALEQDPKDARALRAIERLTAGNDARMAEALETLGAAAQQMRSQLFGDEQESGRTAAIEAHEQAKTELAALQTRIAAEAEARVAADAAERAERGQTTAAAQERLDALRSELSALEARRTDSAGGLNEVKEALEDKRDAHETCAAQAEAAVENYEQAELNLGISPSDEEQAELARLGAAAEALVDEATTLETQVNAQTEELATLEAALSQIDEELAQLRIRVEAADDELALVQGHELLDEEPAALTLRSGEAAEIAEAEQHVAAAARELARFGSGDESERAAQRKQQLADLVQLYVIMGRFYVTRVGRADFGLSCYSQALEVDPDNDTAFDALIEVYRSSQAWNELVAALTSRADRVKSPVRARECRAQAAVILVQKLADESKARSLLDRVLEEDPAHELAHDTLATILTTHEDYEALGGLLERRLSALLGDAKLETRLKLAELYEDRLGDTDRAEGHYVAVAEAAPRKLDAWKGLERIYARKENYEGLLAALRSQIDLAPTPRQRIALFERIGLLLEEEFVNYDEAAQTFEQILAIDATNEAGNVALARLYHHLSRFEDMVRTLLRLATIAKDPKHKVELLLQVVRTFNVDIGSPERAMEACERILEIDPEEPEALSELARLKSTAGDLASALSAVERLAEHEQDPYKQADHWIRAGKLLEEHGDRDGAISRYKRALDADARAMPAVEALRAIYTRRGDAHGAIDMLNYAIQLSDSDRKRAQLYAQMGSLHHERLEDESSAEQAFNTALALDASCTAAQIGLGRIEFGREHFEQAAGYLGTVLGRLDELPQDEAAEVCRFAGDSFRAGGQMDKAIDAYKRGRDYAPDDLAMNELHAALVRESGDAKSAERLYERIYTRFQEELDLPERLRVLRAWGETQLEAEQVTQAIATFKDVLSRKPDDLGALDGLTKAYKANEQFQEVINLLQLRSRATNDPELRFRLLVQTGDVFLEHIRDRDAAAQTYVMALDQQPNNRNLLTKLMAVYSDAQDWSRLIEVILRIAEMVDAPDQVAKYYNTAATIAHKELGRFDEAANYYEAALASLPAQTGAAQLEGLVECLIENQDWERLERAYETRMERMQEAGAEPVELAGLLEARARVLAERLGRTSDALELYEQAQQLDPDNRERREMLTSIYTKEPKRYFVRAVAAHRSLLADDPYRVESLQALRRIYTSGKRPDESWCLCQALRCLQMADVDEEKFFKKYRLASLPRAKRVLDEELYRAFVWHPIQDASLTAIFATLAPAITATQSQPLTNFGIDPRNYADPASDPTAMARMLHHVAEMTAMHLPEVYHYPNDPGGLSFLFALPPAIGIGMGARAGGPQQALAFVAARHVSYYRAGHYIRQLVPTGTGLRTWLFAAIRLVVPKFPIPGTMEAAAKECIEAIRTQLTGPQRDALRSLTQKLLEAAPELDMKSWMAGVDLSADRLGFVLSNDLKVANAVIDASPEDASVVAKKDRTRELLVYSVSEEYFELRKSLGIALGG